jgi:hypothetical protein
VVNVHSGHPTTNSDRQHQQRQGISTSRDPAHQRFSRGWKMTASQQFPMAIVEFLDGSSHRRIREESMSDQTATS